MNNRSNIKIRRQLQSKEKNKSIYQRENSSITYTQLTSNRYQTIFSRVHKKAIPFFVQSDIESTGNSALQNQKIRPKKNYRSATVRYGRLIRQIENVARRKNSCVKARNRWKQPIKSARLAGEGYGVKKKRGVAIQFINRIIRLISHGAMASWYKVDLPLTAKPLRTVQLRSPPAPVRILKGWLMVFWRRVYFSLFEYVDSFK